MSWADRQRRRAWAEEQLERKTTRRGKTRAEKILALRQAQQELLDKLRDEHATLPSSQEAVWPLRAY